MSAGSVHRRLLSQSATWNLLKNLTMREVLSEFKRTALGRAWSLISPLAQIAVFSVVFGLIFGVQADPGINSGLHVFGLWIAVGIVTWGFINGAIKEGMNSLLGYSGMLQKVYLPRWTLPLSKVLARTFTFLTELLVVTIVIGIFGGWQIVLRLWMVVPLILLVVAFAFGIGLALSVVLVYFRDLEHLWTIISQVWFYASGVMFPVSLVEQRQAQLDAAGHTILGMQVPLLLAFELNPATQFLTAFRNVLYDWALPSWETMLVLTAWSACSLIVGVLVFRRFSARIVEEL